MNLRRRQPTHHAAPDIVVHELVKQFTVPVRSAGVRSALGGVFRRNTREVVAVDGVSFDVSAGEIIGFLGSNGAGKSTTLKMLAGLLKPTDGLVRVAGHDPSRRSRHLLRRLALVMGQRSQLMWDLPASDSFDVARAIYRIPRSDWQRRVHQFSELLEIEEVVRKPVRNLSLGERMKCELACALLHGPDVLFLDEPTIGLDVTMQRRMREFLRDYNLQNGATVLLTSHYMADVEALCERIVAIDRGQVVFDGSLADMTSMHGTHKTLHVTFEHDVPALALELGHVGERSASSIQLHVARTDIAATTQRLLALGTVHDLAVEDPPIEELVERVYHNRSTTTAPKGGDPPCSKPRQLNSAGTSHTR